MFVLRLVIRFVIAVVIIFCIIKTMTPITNFFLKKIKSPGWKILATIFATIFWIAVFYFTLGFFVERGII